MNLKKIKWNFINASLSLLFVYKVDWEKGCEYGEWFQWRLLSATGWSSVWFYRRWRRQPRWPERRNYSKRKTELRICRDSRRWSSGTTQGTWNSGHKTRKHSSTGSLKPKAVFLKSLLCFGSMEVSLLASLFFLSRFIHFLRFTASFSQLFCWSFSSLIHTPL